jgi:hypothetical protein
MKQFLKSKHRGLSHAGMTLGWMSAVPVVAGGPSIQTFAELGRTTLGSANATIAVTGLANKKWLLVLCDLRSTASLTPWLRINNVSTGTPYSDRKSQNGAADTTDVSQNQIIVSSASATNQFIIFFIENVSTQEKLVQGWSVDQNTAGSANVPNRQETVGKWADTTNAINEIDIVASTSTFATGSEVVVLGADPSDTNVTPFFVELGRVTLGGTSSNIQISVAAKKYLFTTIWQTPTAALREGYRFNNDSGLNYDTEAISNGGADISTAGTAQIFCSVATAKPDFCVGFILNITGNEKLVIAHSVGVDVAGATNAPPNRRETTGKWVNTSSQITEVDYIPSASTFAANTEAVVYGSN